MADPRRCSTKPTIRVFESPEALAREAAETFAALAQDAVEAHGRFTAAVSGGSTPKRLYEMLAEGGDPPLRARVPWDRVFLFSGDERAVPPSDERNNFRMLERFLLSKVPIPAENAVRFESEADDPEAVARRYEERALSFFRLAPGEFPRFDLILLGMGPDGHTASLFPGTEAIGERSRLAVAPWVESLGTRRYTITFPVINNAVEVLFLVAGKDKAEILRRVLAGEPGGDLLPARLVNPTRGRLTWFLDRDAAARLPG